MPLGNAFDPNCPTRQLLDRIADKWTVLVVSAIGDRAPRFGELRRAVGGISQKVLTSVLRSLERDGLVTRNVLATGPLRVEYRLTPLGHSLLIFVDGLREWAERRMVWVAKARTRYDRLPRTKGGSPSRAAGHPLPRQRPERRAAGRG